jgi:hypothetical protein
MIALNAVCSRHVLPTRQETQTNGGIMERPKDIEVKALDTLTENVIASSVAVDGGGSVAAAAEWKTAEIRKGRLVMRVPAPGPVGELPPVCVCRCVSCINGCFPCTLTA